MSNGRTPKSIFPTAWKLLKLTTEQWLGDKAPQLAAALAFYTVFSLAPLVLLLFAVIGVAFRNDPAGAWSKVTGQMSYFLDKSAIQVIEDIARTAAAPGKSTFATIIGIVLALLGASGVFGQLQDALNTIWGVKAKPTRGIRRFLRARFLSFAMRRLFPITGVTHDRSAAERLQPLHPTTLAGRSHCSCRRLSHL